MKISNEPIGINVIEMLKSMFRVIENRAAQQTNIKLTMFQFKLLYSISVEREEVILKDMAEKMGKDKSSILRMINLLEKKELVRRVVDQNDRRKNQLMVTKMGERFILDFQKIEQELNIELQEGLSESDIQQFLKVVNHLKMKSEQLLVAAQI